VQAIHNVMHTCGTISIRREMQTTSLLSGDCRRAHLARHWRAITLEPGDLAFL
ncbi:hypothetical protein Csa_010175, partial [Cucumis sativus]